MQSRIVDDRLKEAAEILSLLEMITQRGADRAKIEVEIPWEGIGIMLRESMKRIDEARASLGAQARSEQQVPESATRNSGLAARIQTVPAPGARVRTISVE